MSRTARGLGLLAASAVLCALLPGTAHAAAQVSLSVSTADPDYATRVTLRGTGFQAVNKAHGGVYITFGWVADGAWQPSKGGSAGATYRYVQDTEDKNNKGYQRYVAFPGSDTAASANGGVMSADGSWSTDMVIPGARFRAVDRSGNTSEVDCTKVRCGFITMGAHGVVNANNETFTPVRFAAPGGTAGQPGTQAQAPAPVQQQGTPQQAGQPAARAATVSSATGVVEAGKEVAVTGTGFAADEQLTVTLGPSKLFLAPAKSDAAGAVTHSAAIPADVPAGAYTLEFTGATSGAVGSVPLTVTAAAGAQAAPEPVAAESSTSDSVPWWWLAIGGAFLLLNVTILFRRKRKKVEA